MTASHPARLLVDVTRTVDSGLHSGIQRVVRGLLRGARAAAGPGGPGVHPVRFDGDRWLDLTDLRPHPLEALPAAVGLTPAPKPLVPRSGDLLLLADASWYLDPWPAVRALRDAGGRVAGFVHDLLPLRHPAWFREGVGARFHLHLQELIGCADELFVGTHHVARQLQALGTPQPVTVLPLASSLGHCEAPAPRIRGADYLAVATVEPRKNHALLLDAFETLWAEGRDERLVIVGAPGWQNDATLERLRTHPELGRRLRWYRSIDDARLRSLYMNARSLLYLSRDEGFGLPVLEARELGCPVVASAIPPLREAGGDWPRYIDADDREALLGALRSPELGPAGTRAPRRCWTTPGRVLVSRCRPASNDRVRPRRGRAG